MDKVLSVSIAAYNVELYIEKTLDSFICDEDLMRSFEIIVVNDGSKDDTSVVSKKYVDKYPDTFVLIDKENGGYGSTINASLEIARGKYFKLVDGDDWVDTAQFVELVNKLRTESADVVLTKYYRFNDADGSIKIVSNDMEYDGILRDVDTYTFSDNLAMHQITYKTELLRKIGMRITEKCYYTDFEYTIKPLPYIKSLNAYDLGVYVYRIGREGQSVQLSSWFKNIDQGITVSTNLAAYYENVKKDISSEKMRSYIRNAISESTKNKYLILTMMPISMNPHVKIKSYDRKLKCASEEIYCFTLNMLSKKWRLLIRLMRVSGFTLFKPINVLVRSINREQSL